VKTAHWAGILILSAVYMAFNLRPLAAAGVEDWIAVTDRSDNPVIIEYLSSADFSQSCQIVAELGKRADPYISDILGVLLEPFSGTLGYRQQHLARTLLLAVFPPALSTAQLERRLSANPEGLSLLARGLNEFQLPLRREAVRVMRSSGSEGLDKYIVEQAAWCYRLLERQSGRADAEQRALIVEILEFAEARRNPDFLDPVLRILEATRDRTVAEKALQTARNLAGLKTAFGNREES
jgi:hypothetical protein